MPKKQSDAQKIAKSIVELKAEGVPQREAVTKTLEGIQKGKEE